MLTKAEVEKLLRRAPEAREWHPDGGVPGLKLMLTPGGEARWVLRYTRPGSRSMATLTIGDARAVGLAVARKEAKKIRGRVANGEDPQADRVAARKAQKREGRKARVLTVERLFEQWMSSPEAQSWRPKTRSSFESIAKLHILPALGRMSAVEVERADVRAMMRRVHRKAPVASNRAFEVTRLAFNWAVEQDLLVANPCGGIKRILRTEKKRDRVYTDDELRGIVEAADGDVGDLIRFILRTGTRSHETRAMRWDQIDSSRRVWAIPSENAKSDRKHSVPLSDGAWRVLEARREKTGGQGYVFPTQAACHTCEREGHMLPPTHRIRLRIGMAAGLPQDEPVNLHDLRRTVGDRMYKALKVDPHVVDQGVLGHAAPALMQTYLPSGPPLSEVATALAKWDAHLDEILTGERPKIVSIHRS